MTVCNRSLYRLDMILTVTTVVILVIGVLSLVLALYGGHVSTEITEGMKGNQEQQSMAEQKYYLLGMIGFVVLIARLVNVPVFFWTLQTLVPYCPGAMCSYGVVNVSNPFSSIDVILKVLLPFVYGTWLVIELSSRRLPELPMTGFLARTFLFILVPLVLVDSALDLLTIVSIRPIYAPCCSSAYDVDPPFSPSSVLGPEFGLVILAIMIILTLVFIALQWAEARFSSLRNIAIILTGVLAVLYLVALHDIYAPLVLGLPTHHCPYCLFQEFPDTAFFSGLYWVGLASAGWRIIITVLWERRNLDETKVRGVLSVLLKVSSIALLFSMVSMVSHLIIAL